LKQFIKDYNSIREIWYNVEPLDKGEPRAKVDNLNQLSSYIKHHPFFQATTKEQGPGSEWSKGEAASWISKTICGLDINICQKFVHLVESGMTAYDWPLFAVMELKFFRQSPIPKEIWNSCYEHWFEKNQREHIEHVLKQKQSEVNRAHFLPQVHEIESTHKNKKRKVK
jgi:hypothetical protein